MKVQYRVKSHEDFQQVIQDGKKEKSKNYIVCYLNRHNRYPRLGISAPKKLGNAVVRNKVKRQIRGMIHELWDELLSLDYVIVVRKDYSVEQYHSNQQELKQIFLRIRRKQNEESA